MAANGFWKYVVLSEKRLNSNQSSLASCIKGRKVAVEIARCSTIATTESLRTIMLGIKGHKVVEISPHFSFLPISIIW